MPSVGSVGPARRVRLADILPGAIPDHPTLRDSSGDEYDSLTVSASRTLESKYFIVFLVICKVLWIYGLVKQYPFFIYVRRVVFLVANLE